MDLIDVLLGRVLGSKAASSIDKTQFSLQVITLSSNLWTELKRQIVNVDGMPADDETNLVLVAPASDSASDYSSYDIKCTEQAAGSLTFTCSSIPENDIDVVIAVWDKEGAMSSSGSSANFVSYSTQIKSDEQKRIARDNIGAGNISGYIDDDTLVISDVKFTEGLEGDIGDISKIKFIVDDKEVGVFVLPEDGIGESDLSDSVNAKLNSISAKQDKSSISEINSPTSLTLSDNKEYYLTNVSDLTIMYPSGHFECWIRMTMATSGSITITLPDSNYLGRKPVFKSGETWEISIKDGYVISDKVEVDV